MFLKIPEFPNFGNFARFFSQSFLWLQAPGPSPLRVGKSLPYNCTVLELRLLLNQTVTSRLYYTDKQNFSEISGVGERASGTLRRLAVRLGGSGGAAVWRMRLWLEIRCPNCANPRTMCSNWVPQGECGHAGRGIHPAGGALFLIEPTLVRVLGWKADAWGSWACLHIGTIFFYS